MHIHISEEPGNETIHHECLVPHKTKQHLMNGSTPVLRGVAYTGTQESQVTSMATMFSVHLFSVLLSLAVSTRIEAALPQFSWDTLPVFFHSSIGCGGMRAGCAG